MQATRQYPEIIIPTGAFDDIERRLRQYSPKSELGKIVRACFAYLPPDLAGELLDRVTSCVVLESSLSLIAFRYRGLTSDGFRSYDHENYGVVGHKVITDAGVAYLVDSWQNLTELELMKFHSLGTGSTAEAVGDTALVTELTTEYNPNSTRATGTTTETSANIYSTVATNTLDGTPGAALREHGIHSAASAGTLWDRTVYAAITLSSGDALQSSYALTCTSGG
jgi:hypothetical protein